MDKAISNAGVMFATNIALSAYVGYIFEDRTARCQDPIKSSSSVRQVCKKSANVRDLEARVTSLSIERSRARLNSIFDRVAEAVDMYALRLAQQLSSRGRSQRSLAGIRGWHGIEAAVSIHGQISSMCGLSLRKQDRYACVQ